MNGSESPRLTMQDNPSYTGREVNFMSDETGGENIRPTGEEGRPPEPPRPPRPPRDGERRGRGRPQPPDDENRQADNDDERREEEIAAQREVIRERHEAQARAIREGIEPDLEEITNQIRRLPKSERIQKIKEYLKRLNPSSRQGVPTSILELAAEEDETLEYLVNKIVVPPLDSETGDYQLGLYASSTLEELREILRSKSNEDRSGVARKRYEKALGIIDATRNFHHMNKMIVMGVLKSFVDAAQVVTPEQLQTLQNVPGVAQVQRLFDEELTRYTAKADYINKERYNMLMGSRRNPETGEIELIEAESIKGQLEDLQKREIELTGGKDTSESIWGLKNLESWQLNWAFLAGRILSNISLRSAENMSIGNPGKGPASGEGYYSPPLESAQTLVNPMRKYKTFSISEGRYGVKFVDMVSQFFQRDREKQGYGKTRVKKISGKDIVSYEDSGLFEVAGIFAGWRQEALLLDKSPIPEVTILLPAVVNGAFNGVRELKADTLLKLVDIDFMEKERREELHEKLGWSDEKAGRQARKELPRVLRAAYLDEHGNLRSEINANLGVLLRSYSLTPKEEDSADMREARRQIREKIWQRVAEDDPLAIIPFLIETELNEKDVSPADRERFRQWGWVSERSGDGRVLRNKELTDILRGEKDGPDNPLFSSLREKLRIAHERRLAAIRNRQTGDDIKLDNILKKNGDRVKDLELTPGEEALLERIRANGKLLAPDLATIRQPFNPFMNDVLFERADYSEPGAEFFRRRMGGDLAQLEEAHRGILDIMNNPGGLEWKEIADNLYKMVQAIGIVHSIQKGQDRVAPVVEALLTMMQRGGQIDDEYKSLPGPIREAWKLVANTELYNIISNKIAEKPNSMLQTKAGEEALAVDKEMTKGLLESLLHKGVLRRKFVKHGVVVAGDLYERFRKKFKTTLLWRLLEILFNIVTFVPGVMVFEATKSTVKGK